MKFFLIFIFAFLPLFSAFSQDSCFVTGTITSFDYDVARATPLLWKKEIRSGVYSTTRALVIGITEDGVLSFNLPRNSTVVITGWNVDGFNTGLHNVSLYVPDAATADLSTMYFPSETEPSPGIPRVIIVGSGIGQYGDSIHIADSIARAALLLPLSTHGDSIRVADSLARRALDTATTAHADAETALERIRWNTFGPIEISNSRIRYGPRYIKIGNGITVDTTGERNIVMGDGSYVEKGTDNIILGTSVSMMEGSNYNIAIGKSSIIGYDPTYVNPTPVAQYGIAIGNSAQTGTSGIAIGYGAAADSGSISIGQSAYSYVSREILIGTSAVPAQTLDVRIGNDMAGTNQAQPEHTELNDMIYNFPGGRVQIGSNSIVNGSRSTAIGYYSTADSHSVAIGGGAYTIDNFGTAVGTDAGVNGKYGVSIGGYASTTYGGTAVGTASNASDWGISIGILSRAGGVSSTALGIWSSASGRNAIAIGDSSIASDIRAIAIGTEAEANADDDIYIGYQAGKDDTTSGGTGLNIAIGYQAAQKAKWNYSSIYIGEQAGYQADGTYNIGIGAYTFSNRLGPNATNQDIAIGLSAMETVGVGDATNIAIGSSALENSGNKGGLVSNIAIGYQAARTPGGSNAYNTVIGYQAKISTAGTQYSTALGYHADVKDSYTMVLGDSATQNGYQILNGYQFRRPGHYRFLNKGAIYTDTLKVSTVSGDSTLRGQATLGAGDSVQVTIPGIALTDVVVLSYTLGKTSTATETMLTWTVMVANKLTIYGVENRVVNWIRIL